MVEKKLFPNPISDRAAEPDEKQSHYNIRSDICQSIECLAITQEVEGVVAEGGEGGESAEDADEEEGSRFRGKSAARFNELREEANDETADQVDGERAVGKVDTFGGSLHPNPNEKAGYRSKCAAEGNIEDR